MAPFSVYCSKDYSTVGGYPIQINFLTPYYFGEGLTITWFNLLFVLSFEKQTKPDSLSEYNILFIEQ
jgi:hypothetical protein